MAEFSDTAAAQHDGEQDEGTGYNGDINTWLSKHRLNKFKQYFEENEVILEDLLTYNENEINSVINECKITATAYKKRFKDSIRQLQFTSNKGNIATSPSSQHIYRVVMSIKESEVMDKLKAKLSQINQSMDENKNETNKVSNNTQNIENDIKSVFAAIRKETDKREKALMIQLNDISNDRCNTLKNQKRDLEQYQKSIENAMHEQNSLLLDPTMDSNKRQNKIEEITNNTLNNIDDNNIKLTLREMRFINDRRAITEYISNIGTVTVNSDAPSLKVTDITSTAAKVIMECKVDDDVKIKYHLKYKPTDIDDDDEKKGNWSEVDIDNNKNEYVLHVLKKDTKYAICGKYQTSKDVMWSLYSPHIVFKTLNIKTDDWDVNCRVIHSGDIVSVGNEGWRTIWLKKIVSSGKHEWRVKIIKNVEHYQDFGIGITNENEAKGKDVRLMKRFCFMVASKTEIRLYQEDSSRKTYNARAQENDVITMAVDFGTKQLSYMINGNSVAEPMTFTGGRYRAAVSLYHKDNAIEIL